MILKVSNKHVGNYKYYRKRYSIKYRRGKKNITFGDVLERVELINNKIIISVINVNKKIGLTCHKLKVVYDNHITAG